MSKPDECPGCEESDCQQCCEHGDIPECGYCIDCGKYIGLFRD